jgi:predicted RNase H-like HicB family nuclease
MGRFVALNQMMASATNFRIGFNILIYREDQWWIAHCLEMDLPAEGNSPQEALENLVDLVNLQIDDAVEHGDLQTIFSPAPPELWKMFAISREFTNRQAHAPIRSNVSALDVRELETSGI